MQTQAPRGRNVHFPLLRKNRNTSSSFHQHRKSTDSLSSCHVLLWVQFFFFLFFCSKLLRHIYSTRHRHTHTTDATTKPSPVYSWGYLVHPLRDEMTCFAGQVVFSSMELQILRNWCHFHLGLLWQRMLIKQTKNLGSIVSFSFSQLM